MAGAGNGGVILGKTLNGLFREILVTDEGKLITSLEQGVMLPTPISGNFLYANGVEWMGRPLVIGDIPDLSSLYLTVGREDAYIFHSDITGGTGFVRKTGAETYTAAAISASDLPDLSTTYQAASPVLTGLSSGLVLSNNKPVVQTGLNTFTSRALGVADLADLSATYQTTAAILNNIKAAQGTVGVIKSTNTIGGVSISPLIEADLPPLSASKTTSGVFATARIPDLSATYQPKSSSLDTLSGTAVQSFGTSLLTKSTMQGVQSAIAMPWVSYHQPAALALANSVSTVLSFTYTYGSWGSTASPVSRIPVPYTGCVVVHCQLIFANNPGNFRLVQMWVKDSDGNVRWDLLSEEAVSALQGREQQLMVTAVVPSMPSTHAIEVVVNANADNESLTSYTLKIQYLRID